MHLHRWQNWGSWSCFGYKHWWQALYPFSFTGLGVLKYDIRRCTKCGHLKYRRASWSA